MAGRDKGKYTSPLPMQKALFYKYFYALAGFACLVAAAIDFKDGYYLVSATELLTALSAGGILIYILRHEVPLWAIPLSALFSFAVFSAAVMTQMDSFTGLIWLPLFPIIYSFLTGYQQGLAWTSLSLLMFAIGYFIHPHIYESELVNTSSYVQTLIAFFFATLVAYIYERIRDRHEKMLQNYAEYDYLTGINNRRSLSHLMEYEILQSQRYQKRLSFMLLDVDDFKKVNDVYGHKAGDILLQSLSLLARDTIRRSDIIARWGGEEFALLMPETDLSNAEVLAEKIRVKIQNHQFLTVGHITVSIGVAELRVNETLDALIVRADQMLYQAKNHGKNCVKVSK